MKGMRRRAFIIEIEHLALQGRDMKIISYELKYCERCGTLKLRPLNSGSTYCRRCEGLLTRYKFLHGTSDTNAAALSSAPEMTMVAQMPLRIAGERVAGVAK